jgi:hypothetical protein
MKVSKKEMVKEHVRLVKVLKTGIVKLMIGFGLSIKIVLHMLFGEQD